MIKDFLITEVHYEQQDDGKSLAQKESEARADATIRRFKELRQKAWKAGFHITARPVLDEETQKHFTFAEIPIKEGLPRLKMRDLGRLELKEKK